jgi:hypothetical protein
MHGHTRLAILPLPALNHTPPVAFLLGLPVFGPYGGSLCICGRMITKPTVGIIPSLTLRIRIRRDMKRYPGVRPRGLGARGNEDTSRAGAISVSVWVSNKTAIIKKAQSLNLTSRLPYLYGIGEDTAAEIIDAARAMMARIM